MNRKSILIDSSVVVNAYDNTSEKHDTCQKLIIKLKQDNYDILMPMHTLFEIHCAMERLTRIEKNIYLILSTSKIRFLLNLYQLTMIL